MKLVTEPFPHAILDGHWPEELLKGILKEFPDFEDPRWKRFGNQHEGKLEGSDPAMWGGNTVVLLTWLRELIPKLEDTFQIADMSMETIGGGYHYIPPGGHLDMHVDFGRSPTTGLYRRLNCLVFLNKNWRDDGGHLYLGEGREVDITPEFNRTAIFATDRRSWHGHPVPARRDRKSVAAYFYSPEPPKEVNNMDTVWFDA